MIFTVEQKGVRINGRHSFFDFGATLSEHSTGTPEPQITHESVPYMDGFYDFSALGGALTCTSRTASYVFDIEAETEEELEERKNAMTAWLLGVVQSAIYDDYDPDYHMIGTIAGAPTWKPIDPWGGTLTADFACQPKRIRNFSGEEVF